MPDSRHIYLGSENALSPAPDTPRTPTDPQGKRAYGHQILALTDQLNGAATYDGTAETAAHVLDATDGVLARLSDFFEAAMEQVKASETDDGWELAYRFEDAAATLSTLADELHGADDRMRDLGQAQPSRAQAPTTAARTFVDSDSPQLAEDLSDYATAAAEVVRLADQIKGATTATGLVTNLAPLIDPDRGVLECVRDALESAAEQIKHYDDTLTDYFYDAASCLSTAASDVQEADDGLACLSTSAPTTARAAPPAAAQTSSSPGHETAQAQRPPGITRQHGPSPGRTR